MEEELAKHKMAKEQIDQHILSTNLPASDYDTDNLNKEPTFKQDESSILSPNKSSADEYSSFMNDIRTVYELQEEESKLDASQADIQTVIQKPTPTPCLEESEITVFDNELVDQHSNWGSVIVKNGEGLNDFENHLRGMRAVSHNAFTHERQESEIEKQNANMDINFSNLLRKQSKLYISNSIIGLKSFYKNSSLLTGKSFGSKAVSRKVSPKTSNLVSKGKIGWINNN